MGIEHLGEQGLHSFADLQQPDPDGMEYQAVRRVTSLKVGVESIDGNLKCEPVSVCHDGRRPIDIATTVGGMTGTDRQAGR